MAAYLKVFAEGDWKDLAVIANDSLVLGRADSCSIPLPSDTVSRQHLKIFRSEEHYFCVDLNSTNGSTLNDVKLDPFYPYHLFPGDIIILADFPVKFFNPLDEYVQNLAFFFDHNFQVIKTLKFTSKTTLSERDLPKLSISFEKNSFLIEINDSGRILLTSSASIVDSMTFRLTSPGCIRIEDLVLTVSGPREETQATTEARLPALIEEIASASVKLGRQEKATVVIQHNVNVSPLKTSKKSDYLPKIAFESSDFLNLETILWIIIIVSFTLSGVLLLWFVMS